jgi:hypothetical protein
MAPQRAGEGDFRMNGEDMKQLVMTLGAQHLLKQRNEELEEALEKQAYETELKLKAEAFEFFLLHAEDPDDEVFEKLWEKSGRDEALKTHAERQEALARKRVREGYSF